MSFNPLTILFVVYVQLMSYKQHDEVIDDVNRDIHARYDVEQVDASLVLNVKPPSDQENLNNSAHKVKSKEAEMPVEGFLSCPCAAPVLLD